MCYIATCFEHRYCICTCVIGVPAMVENITVVVNITRNNVSHLLSWGEPFHNYDPIVNYTVSCSGDVTCPSNFTTPDNSTRSYTITDLSPVTTYTFSVVATNSIGSGEAGVVMITTPGKVILHKHVRTYVYVFIIRVAVQNLDREKP